MMSSRTIRFCLAILMTFAMASSAFAEVAFKWAPYWRIRHEYWKNWRDADSDQLDNRNFFRIKTSVWGQWDFDDALTLFAKLSNEFKPYTYYAPSTAKATGKTDKGYHFDINEVVFDQLYVEAKNVLDAPVNVRLGRQDLLGMYGEGFLVMDGTPQDGSRTYYFNAAKASWKVDEKNTVDLIYTVNPRDDEYLPVINEDKAPQPLNTTAETGLILDWKSKNVERLPFEGYYIYKTEDDDGGTGYQAHKGKIHTVGCFAKYLADPWTLRGQIAGQAGSYGLEDREANGGYIYLDRDFKDSKWTPRASIGYIHLSGDDRSTAENEAWDPLFSRYPWISELYTLSMAAESGIPGYWTNLNAARLEISAKPTEKLKLSFWHNLLWADEETATNTILSGDDKFRGHLTQARVDYAFSKTVTGYILAEYLFPGDYYQGEDDAIFLRTEIQIKF